MALIRPIPSSNLTEETLTTGTTSIDGLGTKTVTLTASGEIVYYGISSTSCEYYACTMSIDSVSGNTITVKFVNGGGNTQSGNATVKVWHK